VTVVGSALFSAALFGPTLGHEHSRYRVFAQRKQDFAACELRFDRRHDQVLQSSP
jgi:hypothetical protein